jgi:LmbE family N-acetylglucosaminyl deacetylase
MKKEMKEVGRGRRPERICGGLGLVRALSLGLLLCLPMLAETPSKTYDPYAPLPQDAGAAGLSQMLLHLQTTARLMQTVAHPDDEDGGMLTLESRGEGASALLMTLNRGEGGQNKIGSNLFDVLGVLRTLELTASDRYYGVEQRFSRVADFGYSKNPEETFQKWQGHDIALGDMVRVIRTFRPDVLVARFSGTERDGHGHHQASAILTREAFRVAADPSRFSEQIKQGLQPWQAKKLYIGNVCGFGALTCPPENYTVKLNTGAVNPALGMSYIQFAMEGLRHQLSQGAGGWSVDAGPHFAFYKLVDSVLPPTTDKDGHEKNFWDGLDTSLPGLAERLGEEEKKVPWLRTGLGEMQDNVKKAQAAADPALASQFLLSGLEVTQQLTQRIETSTLSGPAKDDLLVELKTKQQQFEKAANLAAGVEFHITVAGPAGANPDEAFVAVPGQNFELTAHFSSHVNANLRKIELDLPAGWTSKLVHANPDSQQVNSAETFQVTVPADAKYTRPYWHRDNPEVDSVNTIDDPHDATLPFSPPPVQAHAVYALDGKIGVARAVAMAKYKDPAAGEVERPLAVAPAFSVMLEPGSQTIRMAGDPGCDVRVGVSYNLSAVAKGNLRLQVPPNWRVEPAELPVEFHQRGEKRDFQFKVFPASLKEGRAEIRAVLTSGGKDYTEGYSLVTREDLASAYYYQPAVQRVSVVDVNVPKGLKVGYIMGAGDDIPTVLEQIGMNVTLIPAEKLASEDLSRYGTIVLGIRAYDTQKDLIANNKKLLDYVSAGGTLVVQYNTGVGDFNGGHFTPYPAQLGRGRVSVEEAPVETLAPEDRAFRYPNQITQKDFEGWVQERGLYFMDQWDGNFKPLLASHDPGEPPLKGGLLEAKYGKGVYIYAGYAFFRQLPAGVPGAIRLYVNLLSAGREK